MPVLAQVESGLQRRLTEAPRRYGWHATIKAPFQLVGGVSEAELIRRLSALASGLPAFELGGLQAVLLDDFLALMPEDNRACSVVAEACVRGLHSLAQPLGDAEIARRRRARLSAHEDALMLRWGYPHVMDCFRFHMSLTGSLRGVPDEQIQALLSAAQAHFQGLPTCRFDRLSVFLEPAPQAPFEWRADVGLAL
jgi:hypothetical protein